MQTEDFTPAQEIEEISEAGETVAQEEGVSQGEPLVLFTRVASAFVQTLYGGTPEAPLALEACDPCTDEQAHCFAAELNYRFGVPPSVAYASLGGSGLPDVLPKDALDFIQATLDAGFDARLIPSPQLDEVYAEESPSEESTPAETAPSAEEQPPVEESPTESSEPDESQEQVEAPEGNEDADSVEEQPEDQESPAKSDNDESSLA